ncbi:MAG TPA: aspartate 1-decarboxylase, partial [Thermoleophilaceae bacterium]|nr:aspartate 1-decarboxylase [Thermoleophilaceae bacterium]
TYTIAGAGGSGQRQVNGAAARLVHTGDTVIVLSYASYDEVELESYEPRVVQVNANNQILSANGEADASHSASVPNGEADASHSASLPKGEADASHSASLPNGSVAGLRS